MSRDGIISPSSVDGVVGASIVDGVEMAGSYNPNLMRYNGLNSRYSSGYIDFGGSQQTTVVVRFRAFTDPSNRMDVLRMGPSGSNVRMRLELRNDGKLRVRVQNTTNANILSLYSIKNTYGDNNLHVCFASYNASTGAFTFVIDGEDVDDITNSGRVATTGTVNANTMYIQVGWDTASNYFEGDIGYLGVKTQYRTNWADFMTGNAPKKLDEVGWPEWGGQPGLWNAIGKMNVNNGSYPNLTESGTIIEVPT